MLFNILYFPDLQNRASKRRNLSAYDAAQARAKFWKMKRDGFEITEEVVRHFQAMEAELSKNIKK
jgi:hypothetical protein